MVNDLPSPRSMRGPRCARDVAAGGLALALGLPIPVVPLELPAYQRKENYGASETFYRVVRACAAKREPVAGTRPSCNILGPTALGFRHRDDVTEITRLLEDLGVGINVVAPWEASPADIARLPDANFNIVLVPEVALLTVDGQVAVELRRGDEVRCHRSNFTVKLVRLGETGFFEALRIKLSWGEL